MGGWGFARAPQPASSPLVCRTQWPQAGSQCAFSLRVSWGLIGVSGRRELAWWRH